MKIFKFLFLTLDKLQLNKSIERCFDDSLLMAIYDGENDDDAGQILDNSQGKMAHYGTVKGHPRAHVSNPDLTSNYGIECVENYSLKDDKGKTGFFYKRDQNRAVHYALRTKSGAKALKALNEAKNKLKNNLKLMEEDYRQTFTVDIKDLKLKMGKWVKGDMMQIDGKDRQEATSVFILAMHKKNEISNSNADVFIQTCYPKLN